MSCQRFKFIWRSLEFLARDFRYFLGNFDIEANPRVNPLTVRYSYRSALPFRRPCHPGREDGDGEVRFQRARCHI